MSNTVSRSSAQIRQDFLDFFASKGHTVVPSSSLVPGNDPTLLFTNAGMVQFKDVFLGAEKRSYTRAVSSQRCVRAGGKHNDLDQVGYTARHHTFFEMLGNFSFGDYFKKEAIHYAWDLLTGVWGLPKEKLLVTIYHTDDEAFDIWHTEIGLPVDRIIRIGDNKGAPFASDNFWQMADTGPCGPCSEIFYDHGEQHFGGPPGSPDEDGDRFIEIWNNVFMQFDRQPDGTLLPLPAPCVDTGMGLERIAAVLQHVHSNYEIDLFQHLIHAAAKLTNTEDLNNKSLRVIADHIRACSFLIADGVLPSNEGRGYVLRRIIRRATRHLWKLGSLQAEGLFWRMHEPLIDMMGAAYPELIAKCSLIEQALKAEEAAFSSTLDAGMMRLDSMLSEGNKVLTGDQLFLLHDTYGCPPDLIIDVLRERSLEPDASAMTQYDVLMEQQRVRARGASKFSGSTGLPAELVASLHATEFKGYESLDVDGCKVIAIIKDGTPVQNLQMGGQGAIILDRTPFYAESGGQIGDFGVLCSSSDQLFTVTDTQKISVNFHAHLGEVKTGAISVGDKLSARVDAARRQATVINHSATHLLHAALRKVLGEHVSQKGSLVNTERTRFDFSHFQAITATQLNEIEDTVNMAIRANAEAEVHHMGMQEAIEFGAMALFGEKYGERVRVLKMGEFSTELCGGTHAHRTGDIGLFKIISEAGIAAGVRRIEAVTGANAVASYKHSEEVLSQAAVLVNGRSQDVLDKIHQLLDRQRKLEQELEAFKSKAANNQSQELATSAKIINGISVVIERLEGIDNDALSDLFNNIKVQLPTSVVVLASAHEGKVALLVGVQGNAQSKLKAGEVISHIASQIGGKGGGRADFARGGGDDGPQLVQALAQLNAWLESKITS